MKILILIFAFLPFFSEAQTRSTARIRLFTQNGYGNYVIEVKDAEKLFEGQVYNFRNVMYGGSFQVGERFNFGGTVEYDRKILLIAIDHSQELALAKFKNGKYSVEPSALQVAQFFYLRQPHFDAQNRTLVEPLALGVFFRKPGVHQKSFNAGVSAGPALIFASPPVSDRSMLIGRMNLRLSIVF